MNKYLELKNKHSKEMESFPMMFAFNDKQFNESLKKLGLKEDESDKICSIGYGGYVRKTDLNSFLEMMQKQETEFKKAIEDDKDGTGFIYCL